MAKETASAQGALREEAPPMFSDDQQKIAYGVGGLALLTYLGSKLFGDGGGDGGPSGNKRTSVRDRSIMREPQMDVSTKGPQEPMLAQPMSNVAPEPVAKPTTSAPLPQATMSGQQQPQMQYGQTTINAPVGSPSPLPAGPAAPPVEANAPVAPKPLDPVTQARIDSIASAERRKQELHELDLAEKKQRIEAAKQKTQGQPISQYSNEDKQLNARSEEAKVNKEIIAANKPKATKTPTANVEKALITLPETPVAGSSVPTGQPPAAPKTNNVKELSLPKEWPSKGMNWITSQYGEEGARQFINQYNKGQPFKSHAEMKEVYDKVMTKPSYSTIPKSVRQDRGITANPEREQYKIVPGGVVPPTLPSGGGGGGMVVPRGSVGNIPGANEQLRSLNPLKL
jgi:hypothetical protein